MNKQNKEEEKIDRTALLLQERKKIVCNLVLLLAASFAVLIGVLTMAWFTNNTKVNGESMSVITQMPDGIKISVGHLTSQDNSHNTISFDENNEIVVPVLGDPDDWFSEIDIGDYYLFGRLFPSSSVSGEEIWYTADAKGNGRKLKDSHMFYRADNQAAANATAHAISYDALGTVASWDYVPYAEWNDTKDDGYYIDIPVWFYTDSATDVSLTVRGYVTKHDDTTVSDGDDNDEDYVEALYKSTRVAILDDVFHSANTSNECGNIIPLLNGENGNSILDSNNYKSGNALYGVTSNDSTGWKYETYEPYTTSKLDEQQNVHFHPIAVLNNSESPQKYIIRIWIDGDDRDCWNATAGQNWKIHLIFSLID